MANQWSPIASGVRGVMVGLNWCDKGYRTSYIEVQADTPTTDLPFKLALLPCREGEVMVQFFGKNAQTGELYDYTFERKPICSAELLTIDDSGFLSAIGRPLMADRFDFRTGFTVQLSPIVVEPIRIAFDAAFRESILERGDPATSGIWP